MFVGFELLAMFVGVGVLAIVVLHEQSVSERHCVFLHDPEVLPLVM